MKTNIKYQVGMPESCRTKAAELYEEAFRQKFLPIVKSSKKMKEILIDAIQPELAVVALEGERLVGLAGFQTQGNSFTGGMNTSNFIKRLGLITGIWAITLFSLLYERKSVEGELLMDGIVVDSEMRGKGIGTNLIQSLSEFAKNEGFNSIRLDVVDTNADAQRLYETQGFVAKKIEQHSYLKPFLGFSSSTTMVKSIIHEK